MAKRKSITGIKRKKPANKAPPTTSPTPSTSHGALESRAESVALGPDVTPGKRTLLSIQNSRRKAQQGRVAKSGTFDASSTFNTVQKHANGSTAHRTYPQSSLKPTIKHVSQDTIQSKWKNLDPAAQAKVESLFQSVGLPVLAKHTKEASKVEAQDAIALVTRSLCKRLPKMPFPKTTKVGHFDYEGLVKSNRELQQRLKSAADSVASSKAELEQQSLELKSERRELQRLENALEDREIQSASLLPLDQAAEPEDMPDAIGLVCVSSG